ncbi:MAG: peptidylprolyl isomerase, partial [Clostridia bacterium]
KKDIDVKKEVKVEPKNDVAKEDVKVLEDVDNKPISTKELEKRLKRGSNDKVVIMSIVIGALVLAFALFGFYFYKTNMQAVVTFDGGKITKAEYTLYYKRYSKMLEQYGYPATMIPEYIANISASDKILLAEAKAAGITISDENKKSVEEMFAKKEEVQAMKDGGMDPVAMKSLYYDQYVILQYIDKIGADASDEEILNYIKSKADKDAVIDMNQYSTRHILIKTSDATGSPLPEADLTKAKTKAESALARVKASEDFATVAKELSEDTGTKDDGGKFVMYMDGKVLPEYTEAVKKLQAGQITDTLIKTNAGYHIIKLDSIDENMRTKSKGEREAFANEKVDKIGETKNVNVNTDELNK